MSALDNSNPSDFRPSLPIENEIEITSPPPPSHSPDTTKTSNIAKGIFAGLTAGGGAAVGLAIAGAAVLS